MSALEQIAGQLTLGELAGKAGISLTTLLDRVFGSSPAGTAAVVSPGWSIFRDGMQRQRKKLAEDYEVTRRVILESQIAKAAYDKNNRRRGYHVPIDVDKTHELDNVISTILRRHGAPMKIIEIRAYLAKNVSRDRLAAAMTRLRDAGVIKVSGNTKARTYAAVRTKN